MSHVDSVKRLLIYHIAESRIVKSLSWMFRNCVFRIDCKSSNVEMYLHYHLELPVENLWIVLSPLTCSSPCFYSALREQIVSIAFDTVS